jgi:hypothetical protein
MPALVSPHLLFALRTPAPPGDLASTMRTSLALAFAGSALLAACVPGGPIYVGPDVVTLEGQVLAFESRAPLPRTEVCVFGTDTLCVAANKEGVYRAAFFEQMLLEGGSVSVRFRPSGYPTAIVHLDSLAAGKNAVRVDCAISQRVTLSRDETACLPLQD